MKRDKQKGNPTITYISNEGRFGIDITINKKNKSFYVSGWYDTFVGIHGEDIKLEEFLELFK